MYYFIRNDTCTLHSQQRHNKLTWKAGFNFFFFFIFFLCGLKTGWREMIFHFPSNAAPLSLSEISHPYSPHVRSSLRRLLSHRSAFSIVRRSSPADSLSLSLSLSLSGIFPLMQISSLIPSSLRRLLSRRSASSVVWRPSPADFLFSQAYFLSDIFPLSPADFLSASSVAHSPVVPVPLGGFLLCVRRP
jgi:hypothetical protein